tara:strand:+ start:3465 stop:3755 length:291 start_codon:yes stop_codon:yes gene_type:complete
MNTPNSLPEKNKNIFYSISNNWNNLEASQKKILTKIWKVVTYKWQLQIIFNLPFLLWWILDYSLVSVHNFDSNLISYLNLPDWLISIIGFGQIINS